ncbi:putative phage head-tail adaptor [Firmicutes bacterium CAG:466]|nr:putative phage head-tail adaptor [Firmicutes bacterium CAG:466]
MENRAADMSFMMEHLKELRTFSDLSFGHWAYGPMMEAANGHDYTRADQNSYESWVDIH